MEFNPDDFKSAYGRQKNASPSGSFSSYLGSSSSGSDFAAGMQSGFKAPSGRNRQFESAYAADGDALSSGLLSQGVGSLNSSMEQAASIGFGGLRSAQAAQQAREMAKESAKAARSQGTMSAISSGFSMLGSLAGIGRPSPAPKPTVP